MTEDSEDSSQVSWNLSSSLIQELARLRYEANKHYLHQNISQALRSLIAMRLTVNQSISEEQRIEFAAMEEQAELIISICNKDETDINVFISDDEDRAKAFKVIHQSRKELMTLYKKYNDMIQDLLEKNGYLIQKVQDVKKAF